MKKIVQFIILSTILFYSCKIVDNTKYTKVAYKPLSSINEIEGVYADTIGNPNWDKAKYYSKSYLMKQDTVDIYKYQFIDNEHLKASILTQNGFQETEVYKGKFNKKNNYFEIPIDKFRFFSIIINVFTKENKRIGIDNNQDLLIDFYSQRFEMVFIAGTGLDRSNRTYKFIKEKELTYIPTKIGTQFGYTNLAGDTLIAPQYDFARVFKKDVARVKLNNKWGLIDKKGNYIFTPQFDYISDISEDSTAYVMNNNYVGLIKNGREILPVNELKIQEFYKLEPNVYLNIKNGKLGIYNTTTKKYKYEPIYDNIEINNKYTDQDIEPYTIFYLGKEKAIFNKDTIVVPFTPKIEIYDIYSSNRQIESHLNLKSDKISKAMYALSIDLSNTTIKREDIYPFYIKMNEKFYIIDHQNKYYELFPKMKTKKNLFVKFLLQVGIAPDRLYIENKPLTYEQIRN